MSTKSLASLLITGLLTISLMTVSNAHAEVKKLSEPYAVMKTATISKMYHQDIENEGMNNPVILQQYANDDLLAAMQLEQDYFDRHQMSCNIDYDVLWDSQDPDYTQDKDFLVTDKGLVQVSLAQGSNIYYELSCTDDNCQVADVILDEDGNTLRNHLLETCR